MRITGTRGYYAYLHCVVERAGKINLNGWGADDSATGVVPAITLDISSNQWNYAGTYCSANTITASNVTKTASTYSQTFSLGAKALGSAKLTYESSKSGVTVSSKGSVTIKPNFEGKAVITIKAQANEKYGAASKMITVTVKPKLAQKITTAKMKTIKASALKKKSKSISLNAKASGSGKLIYKVTKYPKGMKKYISVSSKGKVTLKKKANKGTYKVTITAASKGHYKKAVKVISIKVK